MVVALFFGKGVGAGWIVGGTLVFALVVWLGVMFREVRRAIELPDYLSVGELEADLAQTGLDSAITFPRTGMGKLSFGRLATDVRKSASKPRRRSRSAIATSRNSEANR